MVRSAHVDYSHAQAPATVTVIDGPDALAPGAPPRRRIAALRALALHGLERMYNREEGRFVFRLRRTSDGIIVQEGLSDRYTAITAIGLAGEPADTVRDILGGESLADVVQRLIDRTDRTYNLGDLALIAWAGRMAGCSTARVWQRICAWGPDTRRHATVELSWALSAAAVNPNPRLITIAERIAHRLRNAFMPDLGVFPHTIGGDLSKRSHVLCFADLVYPTLALAQFGAAIQDRSFVGCAARCADAMCQTQGDAGQWWWHFDYRTGRVIERYPVYAVHQDAMAPMALLAVASASGSHYDDAIARGLDWLGSAPELDGGSLVDHEAGLIWRKVARREPGKLTRYLQAGVSRIHSRLRMPGVDTLFPPTAIDYEDRPYHLGWLLYAWPSATRRPAGGAA